LTWLAVWFKSGIVAQMILKVTLINLFFAILGYTDPLMLVGGRYEVHRYSAPLPEPAQDEIAMLLAVWRGARGLWGGGSPIPSRVFPSCRLHVS
jgi:hypothetical protein